MIRYVVAYELGIFLSTIRTFEQYKDAKEFYDKIKEEETYIRTSILLKKVEVIETILWNTKR